jgi:chorismate mutase
VEKYYIVDSSILPDSFGKVIEARQLLEKGVVTQVSEAVKKVGISRGTFYKYKDLVFLPDENIGHRKAVISFLLEDESGLLAQVLRLTSESGASVLTINQNMPIHNVASIVISLDISQMTKTLASLMQKIQTISGASNVHLVAME